MPRSGIGLLSSDTAPPQLYLYPHDHEASSIGRQGVRAAGGYFTELAWLGGQIQGDHPPLSAPVALLQGMLKDLAEEEPANENSPEIATERETGTIPGRAAVPRSRRLVRWGIAGAALSAAAASAAIMLPSVLAGPPAQPAPGGPGPGGHQHLTARAVLLRAAQATAAIPDLHPRPDQFIYTESVSRHVTQHNRLFVTRAWLSVDGWHGGLTLQRWASGTKWYNTFPMYDCLTLPHSNWYYKANCPTPPAYVTNLPRTVKAMKRYLLGYGATGQGQDAGAIMSVTGFYQFLVPHRASALMFRALSQIKGIRIIGHATTLAGRKGIGVAAYDPSRGTLDELIFDPKTYLYIGDTEIAVHAKHMPQGTVNGNAVLQIAVVDKPGQLP